jgi:hypothetical protein
MDAVHSPLPNFAVRLTPAGCFANKDSRSRRMKMTECDGLAGRARQKDFNIRVFDLQPRAVDEP